MNADVVSKLVKFVRVTGSLPEVEECRQTGGRPLSHVQSTGCAICSARTSRATIGQRPLDEVDLSTRKYREYCCIHFEITYEDDSRSWAMGVVNLAFFVQGSEDRNHTVKLNQEQTISKLFG